MALFIKGLEESMEEELPEIALLKEATLMATEVTYRLCTLVHPSPKKLEICSSLLHMHCNRMGLDTTRTAL